MRTLSSRRQPSLRRLRVLTVLVELTLPDYPALEPATRELVRDDVVRYVAGQIDRMPRHLRAPYSVGLAFFRLLPLLARGTTFLGLDRPDQRAYLAAWSRGPLRLARDFVKLIRSCAVFAYFDHETVRHTLDAELRAPRALPAPAGADT